MRHATRLDHRIQPSHCTPALQLGLTIAMRKRDPSRVLRYIWRSCRGYVGMEQLHSNVGHCNLPNGYLQQSRNDMCPMGATKVGGALSTSSGPITAILCSKHRVAIAKIANVNIAQQGSLRTSSLSAVAMRDDVHTMQQEQTRI